MDAALLPATLANLAEGQFGFVTMQQAADAGVADLVQGLFHARVAEPVTPDVFRLRAGARHPAPRLYAAWLALAPATPAWERRVAVTGVVSHNAALRLYRVGDQPGPELEFTLPPGRPGPGGAVADPAVWIHRAPLPDTDVRSVAGLPVTSPARTVIDVADRLDEIELSRLVDAFVAQGWTTAEDLRRDAAQQGPSASVRFLRAVLADPQH